MDRPVRAIREVIQRGAADAESAAVARLHMELAFYDRSATNKRRSYQALNAAELVVAASMPVAASFGAAGAWLEDVPVAVELRRRSRCDDYAGTSVTASSVAVGMAV
jgi:hypothetical protein